MEKHLVAALIYDRLCTFEFGCIVELFGLDRPELGVQWYDFGVCSLEAGPVSATGGITIGAPHGIDLLDRADTIIIPGWRGFDAPVPEELREAIRRAFDRGARIASICSGVVVLAESGILDGRIVTTHWRYSDALARRYPGIRIQADVLYVDEGQIITSAGSAAGIDMMLHLIRRDHGARICNLVARRLVVPPHRSGGQTQFAERPVPEAEDSRLSKVIDYLRANATREHRTQELAKMAAMSSRTFFRRFKEAVGLSPYDWLIRERVEIAKVLLEEGKLSIDQIAVAAGFGAAETLRHHFRRTVGRSPAEYRRTFCANDDQGVRTAA